MAASLRLVYMYVRFKFNFAFWSIYQKIMLHVLVSLSVANFIFIALRCWKCWRLSLDYVNTNLQLIIFHGGHMCGGFFMTVIRHVFMIWISIQDISKGIIMLCFFRCVYLWCMSEFCFDGSTQVWHQVRVVNIFCHTSKGIYVREIGQHMFCWV